MPMIVWNDSLSVNVKDIDSQHRKLVDMINYLNDAMISGVENNVVLDLIEKLKNYTVYHFSEEETYMDSTYPFLSVHKYAHNEFINKVVQIENDFKNGTADIPMDILNYLCSWLVTHINDTDKKLGMFINQSRVY